MHKKLSYMVIIHACPSKLQSQLSVENLAGTEGKFEVKSLLYANKGNTKGKDLLVGLAL